MGHGSSVSPRAPTPFSVHLPRTVAVLFVALLLSTEASAKPPPFDITDSSFAARLRERVADRLRAPSPSRWFDSAGVPPEVVLTPRFVYVRDRALSLPTPPWFGDDAYTAAFEVVRGAWSSAQPDGVRLIMVFTTFDDGGGSLFYLPLANDVAGLGTGKPTEIFDDTPGSALDGVAWLGSVDVLEAAGDDYFREAFIHEVAHRWAAYANVAHGDLPADSLRGRQSMHWSFFASTGDTLTNGESPMEGNAWRAAEDGSWIAGLERTLTFHFSPLDLYLMGVLPPEDVPPFELVTAWTLISPRDVAVTRETAPAHRLGVPVHIWPAEHTTITIDEIIAASGPRDPPARSEVVTWPVGIVLLSNGLQKASFDELVRLDQRIGELVRDFARATDGRVQLDVTVAGAGTIELGAPCSAVSECDRTRADRCAPIRSGGEPVCTRTCQADDDCGPGFCCGILVGEEVKTTDGNICLAGSRCTRITPTTPPPALDRPPVNVDPEPTAMPPPVAREEGSGCQDVHAGRRGSLALIAVMFAILALGRARRST